MVDQDSLQSNLLKAIIHALGSNQSNTWERVKDYLRTDAISTIDCRTCGSEIITKIRTNNIIDDECRDLIYLCSDHDNGLVLLKNACKSAFPSKQRYNEFEILIRELAFQLDNQTAFGQSMLDSFAQINDELAWIDFPDNVVTDLQLRHTLCSMTRPGEPFADDIIALQYLTGGQVLDHRFVLKQLLKDRPSSVIVECQKLLKNFQHCENRPDTTKYLYIIVEKIKEKKSLYQFKAELIEQGTTIPSGFYFERETDGSWPMGTMADLSIYIGKWYDAAKKIATSKLVMEIFLPHELLVNYPDLEIEVPVDPSRSTWASHKLVFNGPYMLRSLERAHFAQKNQLGALRYKWQSLLQGDSVIHTVSKESQLDSSLLLARLNKYNVVGLMMLRNLPENTDARSALIWKVIDSGLPLFSWWHPEPTKDDDLKPSEDANDRWRFLDQCLELNGAEHDLNKDIPTPSHLLDTESAANKRFELACEEDCQSWIHRLMILNDHPERWPCSFLYEHELGGAAKPET